MGSRKEYRQVFAVYADNECIDIYTHLGVEYYDLDIESECKRLERDYIECYGLELLENSELHFEQQEFTIEELEEGIDY